MEITINTKLEDFLLIDEIIKFDKTHIEVQKEFFKQPVFLSIENMAQTGAMHQRILHKFKKHIFLLKIKNFHSQKMLLDGKYQTSAFLKKKSLNAFFYEVFMFKNNKEEIHAQILIGSSKYNKDLKETILKPHYEKLYLCLAKNLKKKF